MLSFKRYRYIWILDVGAMLVQIFSEVQSLAIIYYEKKLVTSERQYYTYH